MNKIRIYTHRGFLVIDSTELNKQKLFTFNSKYHGLHVSDNLSITQEAYDTLNSINLINDTCPIIICRIERSKLKLRWHAHNLFICKIDQLSTIKRSNFTLLKSFINEMEIPEEIIQVINQESEL